MECIIGVIMVGFYAKEFYIHMHIINIIAGSNMYFNVQGNYVAYLSRVV